MINTKYNLNDVLVCCKNILHSHNSNSCSKKRDLILTLIFLRLVGEKYEDNTKKLHQDVMSQDSKDKNTQIPCLKEASFTDEICKLPQKAHWTTIMNSSANHLNITLDTALHSITEAIAPLKGILIEDLFSSYNMNAQDIKNLVNEIDKINTKNFSEENNLASYVYQYFLEEFSIPHSQEDEKCYTPCDILLLILFMTEPWDKMLYNIICNSDDFSIRRCNRRPKKEELHVSN